MFDWVTLDDAIAINRAVVDATGEPFALADETRLKGGLARPVEEYRYHQVHDVVRLAVMTMLGIGNAHGFMQGNKRTAFIAGRLFLLRHGYDLHRDVEKERAAQPYDDEPLVARLFVAALEEKPPKGTMLHRFEDYLAAFVVGS